MAIALGVAFAATGLGSACSSSAKLVAAGGSCALASDCLEGLVCIPDPASASGRSCSSDLTSIQMTELPDAGVDATTATADSGDGAVATYPMDGSAPERDASAPRDSGSGSPPRDSGPVADSAPAPTPDSGPADSGGD